MKKQIVYTQPTLEVDDNICIVASSANLLNNKSGREIDEFDPTFYVVLSLFRSISIYKDLLHFF